jgi:hypothetical protein
MARYGYGYVTDKGFASFARALSEGAWKDVSIEKHDGDGDPPLAKGPLLEASPALLWKLRATWAIRALLGAMGTATADDLLRLDAEWDSSQRALNLTLLAAGEHRDAEHRAAAERLRTALLLGGGTGQTQLSYEKEVDFGIAQRDLAGKAPLSADVKAVGVGEHLERIGDATDALAIGLGRGPGQVRAVSRARRIRDALAACAAAFNTIHDELAWAIEHTGPGNDHQRLEALYAPFLALLERYPAHAKTGSDEGVAEAAPDQSKPAGGTPT